MERRNKLTRSPSMKRRSKPTPLSDRVTLERVLGLTLTNNCGLASSPVTGVIAYPAGCVVVLFNTKKNKQSHIFNTSRKTISALAFSKDGKYVVTGESGHQPGVRVWDVEEKTQVAEFQGHKFGVSCVAFSSNMKYVVSVGYQHDMLVNVWNWRTSTLVASNKVSSKVKAMSFSEDSSYFVTVGNRHVKFWYLDESKASKNLGTVPLLGRSGILGEQRNNFFCDVACGRGMMKESTYCITRSGLLCEFNERRLLDKWVELRTTCANCISVSENHIACGCADGVVRLFDPKTLHYICTLPKPHYLGLDVAASIDPSQFITKNDNAKYPSTIAVKYDEQNNKVTCVYDDHSLYVWDVKDEKKIGKAWSFLYHSSCVWGVETYPNVPEGFKAALPAGSFITCGSDDTIRIWNLDSTLHTDTVLKRNIYSNELLKVIYTDESYQNIRDVDYNPAGSNDKTDDSYGGKNGVRCVKVSPDGQHLASGDRCGNIRVHELQFMDQLKYLEAHDGEVLCLEYANPDQTGLNLLASSSRDRLIHIFQADRNYSLLQTLDDHSAAITAVKFTDHNGQLQMLSCGADKALMFRSLQQGPTNTNTDMQFIRNHYILGKCTFYDMDVDITKKYVATACQDRNVRIFNTNSGKLKKGYKGSLGDDGTLIKVQLDPSGMYAVTSCSDKNLSIYDFYSGECVATMFGHSELVTGVKFTPDLKRLISTSGDGCIFVWKLSPVFTQTMKDRLAELGQQLPTDVPKINIRRDTFAVTDSPCRRETYAVLPNNGPSSVPTTANGHPSPPDLDITAPLLQHDLGLTESDFAPARPSLFQKSPEPHLKPEAANVGPEFDYRFSVLPSWAKKQGVEEEVSKSASDTYSSPSQPRGRWAQRVDDGGIRVKSQLDAEASISLSLTDALERRRLTVEPDSMRDTLKGMAAERGTTGDLLESVQEGLSFSLGMSLDQFEKELQSKTPAKQLLSQVGANRNSEPFERPTRLTLNFDRQTSTEVGLHIEDIEGDAEAGDDTGNIIYPAPSQDLIITPDSPFLVKEYFPMGMKKKKLGAETPRKEPEDTGADTGESQEEDSGSNDPDSLEEDGEGDDEEEEEEDGGGDSLENSEAEEDRISRSLTPSSSSEKPDSETSPQTPEKERFLKHNYENLEVSAALGNETFGRSLDELKPAAEADHFLNPRLSISARFLSRSQQGMSLKRFLPMASVTESGKEIHPVAKTTTANDENLQKKKEEMAMAVDQTRKRLEAMGYKLERASSTESINSEPTRDLTIPVKDSQPKPVTLESHSYSESSGSVSTSRSTTPSSTASGAGTASKASSGVDVPLDIPEKLPSSPSSPPTPSADKENQVFPDTKGGAKSVAKATKQKPVTKSMSMSDLAQKSKSDTKVEACNSPGTHSMTLRARVSQSQPGSPSKPRTLPLPPAKSEPNLADAKDIKKSTKERRRSSLTKDKVSRRSSGSAVAAKARGRSRRSEPLSSAISNPNLATEQGTDKVVKPARGSVVRRNSVGSCVSRKTSDKSESTKAPSVNVVPPSPTRKSDISLEADSSDNAEADRRAMPPPPAGFVSVSKTKSEVKKPQHAEPKIKSKSDPRQKSSLKEKAAKRKVMGGAVSPPVNKMAAQPPKTKQSELVAGTTPGPSQRPPIETLQPVSCDQGPSLAVSSDIDEIPERDTSHPRTSHSDSEVLETYDVHASEGPEWLEAWKKCKKADTPTQPLALDTQPPVVASCITLTSPSRTSKPSPPMPLDITDIIQINLPPAGREQDGPVALQGIGPAVKKDEGQGDGNDVHVQELPARQQEPTVALSKAAPQTKVQEHAFLPVKHSANAATEVPQQGVMEQTEQPEKDSPVSVEMCSQVVEDLRRTFQKAASLHARALQSEVQHKDEVLSMLSATFSFIQSQVTAMNKQSASTSSHSFSPESVQSLSHSIARTRHGSAPDLLEEDDTDTSCALSLLERYSEMMVSMVQQKLTQNGVQLSQHTTKPSGT